MGGTSVSSLDDGGGGGGMEGAIRESGAGGVGGGGMKGDVWTSCGADAAAGFAFCCSFKE